MLKITPIKMYTHCKRCNVLGRIGKYLPLSALAPIYPSLPFIIIGISVDKETAITNNKANHTKELFKSSVIVLLAINNLIN